MVLPDEPTAEENADSPSRTHMQVLCPDEYRPLQGHSPEQKLRPIQVREGKATPEGSPSTGLCIPLLHREKKGQHILEPPQVCP